MIRPGFPPHPPVPCIATDSGYLHLLSPQPEQYRLEELAMSLARTARWSGFGARFCSVAEHTLTCLRLAEFHGYTAAQRRAVWGHDLAEAPLVDMATPQKRLCPDFQRLEATQVAALEPRFGFDLSVHAKAVKRVDMEAFMLERRVLFPRAHGWPDEPADVPEVAPVWCDSMEEAARLYVEAARKLHLRP